MPEHVTVHDLELDDFLYAEPQLPTRPVSDLDGEIIFLDDGEDTVSAEQCTKDTDVKQQPPDIHP